MAVSIDLSSHSRPPRPLFCWLQLWGNSFHWYWQPGLGSYSTYHAHARVLATPELVSAQLKNFSTHKSD
ncbi:hypothetical protein A0H81_07025 [Grifola frondosa]|uniref:Uncharacterized protein n=1 Tax=Grifola frondosa TaxID=5627 RepID=A0A1C7M921_GRIFR|nr:hypothetical protein A0H81_07025 [Grifola frondosa]